uniref:X8 domain-containing protein n=1 Tax=Arcella intermedia TaxID=1963864 RepID=A0A6B2LLC3_9EUKA
MFNVNTSDVAMQSALNYVCANFNCSEIRPGGPKYYPNNLRDHASWAIDAWYQAYPLNPFSCDFSNSASVVCENCTCVLKANLTDYEKISVLNYVCGTLNCSEIGPGGSHYIPNTLDNHCGWAVNTWWHQYSWTYEGCDFGGIAYLTPEVCNGNPPPSHTKRPPPTLSSADASQQEK